MRVDSFDFTLPKALIAQSPANPRDASRLLHVASTGLTDHTFSELPGLLRPDDLLVFNNTRVIPARLKGSCGEAKIEITLHKRLAPDTWQVFAKPGRKLKEGKIFSAGHGCEAVVTGRLESGEVLLRFNLAGEALDNFLETHGMMPLPPYIARKEKDRHDAEHYQTVFAKEKGAVAAPTAGLHFTDDLFAALKKAGIGHTFVTLHVGAGTFLPVKADDTKDHVMHSEWYSLSQETAARINQAKREGRRVVAVGTTSLRTLESATNENGEVRPDSGDTDIFITPGYRFKLVDALLTNFHLPRSTLFMLVCAFSGMERMQSAYDHAIKQGYRFYSYGDATLLERHDAYI